MADVKLKFRGEESAHDLKPGIYTRPWGQLRISPLGCTDPVDVALVNHKTGDVYIIHACAGDINHLPGWVVTMPYDGLRTHELGEAVGYGTHPPGYFIEPGAFDVPFTSVIKPPPPGAALMGMGHGSHDFMNPSSDKVKMMLHLDTAEDLTPQQIEVARQALVVGVPREKIKDALNSDEFRYLKEEQQELSPFQIDRMERVTGGGEPTSAFDA